MRPDEPLHPRRKAAANGRTGRTELSADAGVVMARWRCGASPDAARNAARDLRTFAARHGMEADGRVDLSTVVSDVLGRVIDADGPCTSSVVVDAATDGSSLAVRVARQGCSVACADATLRRLGKLVERIEWSSDDDNRRTVVMLEFAAGAVWHRAAPADSSHAGLDVD